MIELLIFLSLYFANSGLHTHLNLLNNGQAWWTLVVLIILASIAKIVPVTLVSKLCSKKPWFYCLSIGVLMNTRGIVQLVVLNIGVELKVISPRLFSIFVLMATILTFLTSPILSVLYRKKYDNQKLSISNGASEEQSRISTENVKKNESFENTEVISNKSASSIKSNVHLPRNDTSVTFNEQISYIDLERNVNEEESDDNDDNCASYGPRLSISMTRF